MNMTSGIAWKAAPFVIEKDASTGARSPSYSCPVWLGKRKHAHPEDCGGVWGYHVFLQAIMNPAHKEHEAI